MNLIHLEWIVMIIFQSAWDWIMLYYLQIYARPIKKLFSYKYLHLDFFYSFKFLVTFSVSPILCVDPKNQGKWYKSVWSRVILQMVTNAKYGCWEQNSCPLRSCKCSSLSHFPITNSNARLSSEEQKQICNF